MKLLPIDLETFSESPIRVVGHHAYARHPSTEILIAAFTVDNAPPISVSLWPKKPISYKLAKALESPEYIKIAHNASFEYEILTQVAELDLDIRQWQCSMVWAYYASLPGALDAACKAVGLPTDKLKDIEGQKQRNWFSKPRTPTKKKKHTRNTPDMHPDRWKKFLHYARQDVVSMMALVNRIKHSGIEVPQEEWELWYLDQEINRRGLPIDRELVRGARNLAHSYREILLSEARELTGIENPNSPDQIKAWLAEQGIVTETINKEWVANMLDTAEEIPF